MTDQHPCDYCVNPCNAVTRSPLLVRSEALCLYVYLQDRGYLPSMCENVAGTYRVCYSEKRRMTESAAPA